MVLTRVKAPTLVSASLPESHTVLLFVGVTDEGKILNADQMQRLFSLNAIKLGPADIADMSEQYEVQKPTDSWEC